MKKILLITAIVLAGLQLFAQQLPQFSLRTFDDYVLNPAVAGSNSYPEIKLHHRTQWLGFTGAPITSLISYNT